jgi:hypothetical protein
MAVVTIEAPFKTAPAAGAQRPAHTPMVGLFFSANPKGLSPDATGATQFLFDKALFK